MQSYQVQVKMDFNILRALTLCSLQLYTECTFGRGTTAGCSGIPSTSNRPRTCAVNHTTTQGSSIYLDCDASDSHDREASWLKMNQNNHSCFGPVLGKLKNTFVHDNFTLELRNVSRRDDGTYLCIYWDNIVASYCLSVIAIPTLKVTVNGAEKAGVMSAILGEKYFLQCAVFSADPPINLTWSYNKQMYNKDESNSSVNVVGNASNVCTTSLGLIPIRTGSSNVTCVSNGRYQEQDIMSTLQVEIYAIPTMRLTVKGAAPSGTMSAVLGRKYVLQCAAFGADPPVNLTWSYHKQMYNKDESNPSVNVVGNASNVCTTSLGLIPIRTGSSNVTCVSNGRYQEQDIISTLQVEIYAIPTMRITVKGAAPSGTMSAILGQKYVLQCAAFGADPPVNLTWSYHKQMYNKDESNPSVNVVGNASNVCTTSLGLIPIRTGSSNVTCASNGRYQEQDILSTLKVEIYAIPKLFVTVNDEKPNGTLLAVVHRTYDLKCIAEGAYPSVNLTWIPGNEDFFVKEYKHLSFIRKDQTFDSVISFPYTFNQTGSSNFTCSSNGMYSSQNLNHTLHVQVNGKLRIHLYTMLLIALSLSLL
ncbi:Hemicentin-1 [Holothuria leucospilota]|uniref:Hemicentin-1 n=1 Tax=Holothuria leucospilota TaxID=206669 RepID=A0A9Q1H6J1_HOLLE|nr:Hemicentin-1 [Holothuria leucospilota]